MKKASVFQGIPGLERKIPIFEFPGFPGCVRHPVCCLAIMCLIDRIMDRNMWNQNLSTSPQIWYHFLYLIRRKKQLGPQYQ